MVNEPVYIGQQLLEELSKGDEKAFTIVYNRYVDEFYWIGKQIVGDYAPDLVADLFTQLWTLKKRFESERHLYAYLRAMLRNACLRRLKLQQREKQLLKELLYASEQEEEDYYLKELIYKRTFTNIIEDVEKLPEHLRKVFKLAYLGEFKNAEIARILHLKESSVRSCKAQALRLLRLATHPIELLLILNQLHFFIKFFVFFLNIFTVSYYI